MWCLIAAHADDPVHGVVADKRPEHSDPVNAGVEDEPPIEIGLLPPLSPIIFVVWIPRDDARC